MIYSSSYTQTFIGRTMLPPLEQDTNQIIFKKFLEKIPLTYNIPQQISFLDVEEVYKNNPPHLNVSVYLLTPVEVVWGVIKTVGEVFYGVMFAFCQEKQGARCHFYKAARELEEVVGVIIRLFSRFRGTYWIEEARFYKEVYGHMGKKVPFLNLRVAEYTALMEMESRLPQDLEHAAVCLPNQQFFKLDFGQFSAFQGWELNVIARRCKYQNFSLLSKEFFDKLTPFFQWQAILQEPRCAAYIENMEEAVRKCVAGPLPREQKTQVVGAILEWRGEAPCSSQEIKSSGNTQANFNKLKNFDQRELLFKVLGVAYAVYFTSDERKEFIKGLTDEELEGVVHDLILCELPSDVEGELRRYIGPEKIKHFQVNDPAELP